MTLIQSFQTRYVLHSTPFNQNWFDTLQSGSFDLLYIANPTNFVHEIQLRSNETAAWPVFEMNWVLFKVM